jgi:hypothetical protein
VSNSPETAITSSETWKKQMSCEFPIVKLSVDPHYLFRELLTKQFRYRHGDFIEKYANVVGAVAINRMWPPDSLKYTVKTDVGLEKLADSTSFELETAAIKSDIVGRITKIGNEEIIITSHSPLDSEIKLWPVSEIEIEIGIADGLCDADCGGHALYDCNCDRLGRGEAAGLLANVRGSIASGECKPDAFGDIDFTRPSVKLSDFGALYAGLES